MEKKYEWSVEVSTPKEYPVVIQRGLVGKSFFGPSFVSSSWGSGVEIANKQAFIVPDSFEITWLSVVEQKFYKGKWELPKDKIKHYFEKGFNYGDKKINCTKIKIGLAPNGVIIMWLMGDEGMQIEIGRYQANHIVLALKDVADNSKFMFYKDSINKKLADPKKFSPEIKENIEEFGYPLPTVYDLYRERYMWEPMVIVPEGCTISKINIKMCNGENETIVGKSASVFKTKSIPYFFKISWKDKKGQEFVGRIALIKDKGYWQKYIANGNEELPFNFDRNLILSQFKEKVRKNFDTNIVIKIDNESISDFYMEQVDKKFPITEFSYEVKKVFKGKPCICK